MAAAVMTAMNVQHSEFFTCLDQEITEKNIHVEVGRPFMVNGVEITLDPDFVDKTQFPLRPVSITDQSVVDTILLNQSDSSVAAACAAFLEKRSDYVCAESALKDHTWDAVNIEVTSWVDKKKKKVDVVISSDSEDDDDSNGPSQDGLSSESLKFIETANSMIGSGSLVGTQTDLQLQANVGNKRMYRCSRCPFMHCELKEVAAHQASSHLPARQPNDDGGGKKKVAINISKVHCPQCSKFHIVGRYSCRNCDFETLCPMELESHMWQIHKSMHIYHCPCCNFISQSYMLIEEHLVKDHSGLSNTDEGSSQSTENSGAKSTASKPDNGTVAKEGGVHRCNACKFYSSSSKDMHTHISKYHNKFSCMPYMCLLCGKETFNKRGLELHSKNRHKHDPQSFALNSNSLKLMMTTTESKLSAMLKETRVPDRLGKEKTLQWWCIVCGSGPQPYIYHLTPHLASHLFYMPYSCSECDTKFKLQLLATNHLKSSERCWKKRATIRIDTFMKKLQMADIELLRKAVELVDGTAKRNDNAPCDIDMPYICQICQYACKLPSTLTTHMFQHLSHAPHMCPVLGCTEAFLNRQPCMLHIKKAHPGLKAEPNTNFRLLEEQKKAAECLVLENSIHLPAAMVKGQCYTPLISCMYCKFGPCARYGLDIHLALHSPYLPFTCPKCDKTFQQRLLATMHVTEVHHSSDIVVDDQQADKQKTWVTNMMKVCNSISPEYSLKPHPYSVPSKAVGAIESQVVNIQKPQATSAASTSKSVSLLKPDISKKEPPSTTTKAHDKKNQKDSKTKSTLHVFQCKTCGYYSSSKMNLKNHVISLHMPQKPYTCGLCDEAYRQPMFCGKHIRNIHGDVPLKQHMHTNDVLLKQQTEMADVLVLKVACIGGKSPEDYIMQNSRLKPKKLDAEKEATEPEPKLVPTSAPPNQNHYRCHTCNLVYLNRNKARQHFLMRHSKIHPYSCSSCSFESTYYSVVKDHIDRTHPLLIGVDNAVLVTASKEKSLKKSLDYFLNHSFRPVDHRKLQILKGSKVKMPELYRAICIISSGRSCVYKCIKCAYTARSVDAFKKHLQDHLNIEQYRCIFCNYSCDDHIQRHIRTIHGSKDDDIVETKGYIMLVSQLEDLAREVLLLDENCHRDGEEVMETGVPASMPEYKSICYHCKEEFQSLVLARKHTIKNHPAKQLRIEVELNFAGANADEQIDAKGKMSKDDDDDDDEDDDDEDEKPEEVLNFPPKKVLSLPPKKVLSLPPKEVLSLPPKEVVSLPPKEVVSLPPKEVHSLPPKEVVSLPPKEEVLSLPLKEVGKFEAAELETDDGPVVKKLKIDLVGVKAVDLHEKDPPPKVKALPVQKEKPVPKQKPVVTSTSEPVKQDKPQSGQTAVNCHMCKSKFLHMMSLRRHYVMIHTKLRPYSCGVCKSFFSHEKYEIKRHGMKKHGKGVVVVSHSDCKKAKLGWKQFVAKFRKLEMCKVKFEPSLNDPKLSGEVLIMLEDISTNPEYAKYF